MGDPKYRIALEGVEVSYPRTDGGRKVVLNNVELRVSPGELVTVVGPSGCGKSTMLRLVLGSDSPSRGQVLVDGRPVEGVSRDRGIVYQKYSLYFHLKVLDNIAFGPELEGISLSQRILHTPAYYRARRQARERAREFLAHVGLEPADADKYPYELSGGMQQRVAIAQALIMQPRVLLMDEPFGALDQVTREEMQLYILERWKEYGMTIFFVTHEVSEAIFLGTRVIGLSQYWTDERGNGGNGAVIVTDRKTPGSYPRALDYKHTAEFNAVASDVCRDALDPDNRRGITQFIYDHPDAIRPAQLVGGGGADA